MDNKATFQTISHSVNLVMQRKLTNDWLESQNELFSEVPIGIEPTSTALAMAIVKLYSGDDNGRFQEANIGGVYCFVVDRAQRSRFFRLYDANTSELVFQTELFINMKETYRVLRSKFHCFAIHKTVIGVEFADASDAQVFKKLVDKFSFSGDPKQVIKEEKRKQGISQYRLSKPRTMERKQQAGWNPVTQTFTLSEMPKDIKEMLKKAGFQKKQLKQRETALMIYEILLKEVDFEQHVSQMNESMNTSLVRKQTRSRTASEERMQLRGSIRQNLETHMETGRLDTQVSAIGGGIKGIRPPAPPQPRGRGPPGRGPPVRGPPPARGPPAPPGGIRPRAPNPRGPRPRPAARPRAPVKEQPRKSIIKTATKVQEKELSLAEQLKAATANLKKVDHSQVQKQPMKARMSNQQEMKITAHMATLNQQLQARQKALMNDKKSNNMDTISDESEADQDEDSDWDESD